MATSNETNEKKTQEPHWANYNINKLTVRLRPDLLLRFGHFKSNVNGNLKGDFKGKCER